MYYRYENRERNGTYIKADKTVGSFSDAYDFAAGPWLNGTLLDEVVSAGYPFYYLFDDVTDDADDTMNKDGKEESIWLRTTCCFASFLIVVFNPTSFLRYNLL